MMFMQPLQTVFVSLFATCPCNTLCVYSFSKFFGATGWRLGVIALHEHSVYDQLLQDQNGNEVNARYASISSEPKKLSFLERLVADSRSVALHHSAGLSAPQQLQMTLFALSSLIDSEGHYQRGAKRLIRFPLPNPLPEYRPAGGAFRIHYWLLHTARPGIAGQSPAWSGFC